MAYSSQSKKQRSANKDKIYRQLRQQVLQDFKIVWEKLSFEETLPPCPNVKLVFQDTGSRIMVNTSRDSEDEEYVIDENPSEIQMIFESTNNPILISSNWKNTTIVRRCLELYLSYMSKFNDLTTLKLEYCKLTSVEIEAISKFLKEHKNVTHISLDGNPIKEDNNFGILVQNTNLRIISLRLCKLNGRSLKRFLAKLKTPENQTVEHINLSSNYIEDTKDIANMLRINRKIVALNLSDNHFGDEGCSKILDVLQTFALTFQEIKIRRQMNFDHYKQINLYDIKNLQPLRKERTSDSKISIMKETKKASKAKIKRNSVSAGSQIIDKSGKPRVESSSESMLKYFKNLNPITHPFVADSYPENKQIYCKGNFSLAYINFSYNKLTSVSFNNLKDLLTYQSNTLQQEHTPTNNKGLLRIVLDGNILSNFGVEIEEIHQLCFAKQNLLGPKVPGKPSSGNGSKQSKN